MSVANKAVTLVLVHGWCGNQGLWQAQAQHFESRYRVLRPELAGHGQAPAGAGPWTVEAYGQQLAALLEAAAIDQAVLLGHSMGGAVCAEAAKLQPQRVQAVVLGDTFIFDYGHFSETAIQDILAGIRADLGAAVTKIVQDTTPEGTPAALREHIRQEMARTSLTVALPAFESLLRWRLPQAPGAVPLYAINGDLINPQAAERYQHLIHEYPMPGAGHFLHLEEPARFNQILERVLADIASLPR